MMDTVDFVEKYHGVDIPEYQKVVIRNAMIQRSIAENYESLKRMEDDNMTKSNVHLIADETLGGVQREFIEVERMAEVGDFIVTKFGISDHVFTETKPYEVINAEYDGDIGVIDNEGDHHTLSTEYYRMLAPSDIVHIAESEAQIPQSFRLVERKAEVGERVLVIADWYSQKVGSILDIIDGKDFGFIDEKYSVNTYYAATSNINGRISFIEENNYRVLIPVESSEEPLVTVDATQCSEAVLDMLANLARRVTELERKAQLAEHFIGNQQRQNELQGKENIAVYERLQEIGHNVETFAQEHATLQQVVKSVKERGITTAEQTESNTQDIADLDDRTQTLVEPKQAAEALLRKIAKLIEEEGVGI